ncbi:Lactonase, 7-bladed beta-propeller-domain-containing protein [Melampsora americana]|nr:Lactonase, 7-bladed beta-propeller-domain-containing protein [Melampsora americana]
MSFQDFMDHLGAFDADCNLEETHDLHSIPVVNPNQPSNLPAQYQILVGGQPGPFYTLNYDPLKNSIVNSSMTIESGTGPSWVEFDQTKEFMFSSDATQTYHNLTGAGGIFLSKIDKDGRLLLLKPVRVAVDKEAHILIVGTYLGATVKRFRIDPKTRELSKEPVQRMTFTGRSVNPERQSASFIHDVQYTPDYNQVVALDLGMDLICKFTVGKDGELIKIAPVQLPPGCGPRHLAWSPRVNGKLDAYVICSLTRILLTFDVDIPNDYNFTLKGIPLSTEPINPLNSTTLEGSEIVLSPDNRFVITSTTQTSSDPNLLSDNLLVSFPRDLKTGILNSNPIRTPTGGRVPRQFELDPTGQLIAVAQQGASNVLILQRDLQTGQSQIINRFPVERASFAMWRSLEE